MATGFYWCLFFWITCMWIMTGKLVHWILLVSFWLNHLYVHYDSKAWPLDIIGVFLSESLPCALRQLSMATGLYWCLFVWILACALWQLCMATGLYLCLFVWITCTFNMTAMHGHWILLVSLFWITCKCIMTAMKGRWIVFFSELIKHVHWILSVSFCLNHLHVHYESYERPLDCIGVFFSKLIVCALYSYAWPLDCISVFFSESLACALWQLSMATRFYWCLFDWITCMFIMTAMHGHWIVSVCFCLNHLHVHYESYACPLDSISVFLSDSLTCALWQVSMATVLYWCLFV